MPRGIYPRTEFNRTKLISTAEVSQWKEQRFLDFFHFAIQFQKCTESTEEYRWSITKDAIEKMWEKFRAGDKTFGEFLTRANTEQVNSFKGRLVRMTDTVCKFLKYNPAFITTDMAEKIKPYRSLNWCLTNYVVRELETGVEVIEKNNLDTTGAITRNLPNTKEIEVQYAEAMYRTLDIYFKIAKSISMDDLRRLSAEKKISAMAKLAPIFQMAKGFKPNSTVFQQINIQSASTKELEESIRKYAEEQNDEN